MRLAALAKGGYYPTPPRCVDLIAAKLWVNENNRARSPVIRILDPCCGPGDAALSLKRSLQRQTRAPVRTYGVELERERAELARKNLDHSLSADLFQTMIGNGAFQVLFLNPPYDFEEEDRRMEQSFLAHCTRYLETGGLLVFVVPKHRLTASARYLAHYYNVPRVWRFPDPEYDDFDQVALLADRKPHPLANHYVESHLNQLAHLDPEGIDTLEHYEKSRISVSVGRDGDEEPVFTSRRVDPERAALEARRSGLWNNPVIGESLWPEQTPRARPLMPLRRGHMAMMVAGGFMDNQLLEDESSRILVKGRTTKRMELDSRDKDGETWKDRMYTTIRMLDLDTGRITNVETGAAKASG